MLATVNSAITANTSVIHYDEGEHSPFRRLPKELVLLIFSSFEMSDLGRAHRVCKRWKRLAEDNNINLDIDLSERTMTKENLIKAFRYIASRKHTNNLSLEKTVCREFAANLPINLRCNVTSLTLTCSSLTDQASKTFTEGKQGELLRKIGIVCKNLKHLFFYNYPLDCSTCIDDYIYPFKEKDRKEGRQNFGSIEVLGMAYCGWQSLEPIGDVLPNLKTLYLNLCCSAEKDRTFLGLTELKIKSPKLEVLFFSKKLGAWCAL